MGFLASYSADLDSPTVTPKSVIAAHMPQAEVPRPRAKDLAKIMTISAATAASYLSRPDRPIPRTRRASFVGAIGLWVESFAYLADTNNLPPGKNQARDAICEVAIFLKRKNRNELQRIH